MIVAVTGGKGGVGKSTVSLNLGRELDAVVVDGDLATADLPSGRGPDLHDVLAGRAAPMEAVERIGPVRFLPCGRTLAGARAADLERFRETVELLDRQCGSVVVDCPAGLARDVGVQIAAADLGVLVSTPTRPALENAVAVARLARRVGTPVASVVLNRASVPDDERVAERVESGLSTTTTLVPEHDSVAAAQAADRPLRDRSPDSPAVESFEAIARTIERVEEQLDGRAGVC